MTQPPVFHDRRPKAFPPPEFPPRRAAAFARTPPAVFPVILGLLGLGLALRQALAALQLPGGLVEAALGALLVLWAFGWLALAVKVARRPGVLAEDMRVLPGRAGLAAASMSGMAAASVLLPYAPGVALAVALAALVLFPVERSAAGVMIAAASLPVAGNVFILAQHYGVAPQRVSTAILISTAISVLTVSGVIALIGPMVGKL